MDDTIVNLRALFNVKVEIPDKRDSVIRQQLRELRKIVKEEQAEQRFLTNIEKKISSLESKTFNMGENDFERLLEEKDLAGQVYNGIYPEIRQLVESIGRLRQLILSQKGASKDAVTRELLPREKTELDRLESLVDDIKSKINNHDLTSFVKDVKNLGYNKKTIHTGQIISIPLATTIFNSKIIGVENVPRRGPCILAPRHYIAFADPVILVHALSRNIFFMAAPEFYLFQPKLIRA